jgi:hypothetical protein
MNEDTETRELWKQRYIAVMSAQRVAKPNYKHQVLWAFVSNVLGLGATSAIAVCREYGWNPHQRATEKLPYPTKEFEQRKEEQHGEQTPTEKKDL